ncbi:MAG: hypothetical protein J6A49_10655 [Clostridia bacterium]|nr:hypothetical protein [Clostridia bacterium]
MEYILKILNDKIAEYEGRIEYLRKENTRLGEENAELKEKISQYEMPKKVANV